MLQGEPTLTEILREEPKPEEWSELIELNQLSEGDEEQQSPLSPGADPRKLISKATVKKNPFGSN